MIGKWDLWRLSLKDVRISPPPWEEEEREEGVNLGFMQIFVPKRLTLRWLGKIFQHSYKEGLEK